MLRLRSWTAPPHLTFFRMETLPLTCTPSNNPRSSKKRTSSPDAPAIITKKPKTDPGQGHSDNDRRRRRRRRRKQKKQPISRDSGAHESSAVSGSAQNVPSSSLRPASPLPLASRSTASQLSLASSQSDSPFDRSSTPPPPPSVHSSPVLSPLEQRSARKEHVKPTPHSECKVRLLSVSVSNGDDVQTHSLFTTTKLFLRALYPLSCVKSVSIYSTNPSRFPLADMSHVTAVSSTGSTLISNLMDWEVEAFSAKKSVLIVVQ
jgi:hypothetical protein